MPGNRCDTCRHMALRDAVTDGGHCYMFRVEPPFCGKHTSATKGPVPIARARSVGDVVVTLAAMNAMFGEHNW